MTLDEAIKHCNEVACKHDECAMEHKQLAEWLKELKGYKEQKPTDKVEPKFHKGDWIIHKGTENIYQVVARIDNQYQLKYGDNYTIQKCADVDRCARLWDIAKDAKDGDVLVTEPIEGYYSPFVAIYKKQNEEDFDSYCFIGFDGKFYKAENGHSTEGVHPATKEHRDTLMKAIAYAEYTFDFGKKELKRIEQNPAWSEEDEEMFKSLKTLLNDVSCYSCTEGVDKILSWLKSLKDRVQPKQ